MAPTIVILIVVVSALMFVAPLGIWNRLIKINRDQKAHNKAVEKKLGEVVGLLNYIASSDGEGSEDAR